MGTRITHHPPSTIFGIFLSRHLPNHQVQAIQANGRWDPALKLMQWETNASHATLPQNPQVRLAAQGDGGVSWS